VKGMTDLELMNAMASELVLMSEATEEWLRSWCGREGDARCAAVMYDWLFIAQRTAARRSLGACVNVLGHHFTQDQWFQFLEHPSEEFRAEALHVVVQRSIQWSKTNAQRESDEMAEQLRMSNESMPIPAGPGRPLEYYLDDPLHRLAWWFTHEGRVELEEQGEDPLTFVARVLNEVRWGDRELPEITLTPREFIFKTLDDNSVMPISELLAAVYAEYPDMLQTDARGLVLELVRSGELLADSRWRVARLVRTL
jgi:hypothetical protein